MKKFLPLLMIIFAFYLQVQAQSSPGVITGVINDKANRNVEAATISLLLAKDSSVIKDVASDKAGRFDFANVAEGDYLVSVTALGYAKKLSERFKLSAENSPFLLKAIVLEEKSKTLSAVTVTAVRPMIEQKIDRTIVNVDAAISNAGASALEVLEKSPGITLDKDGNISLKGKQGVMVLLDGKPSYLSGAELVNLLRNMNANQLDQIEIMTNPPAKYDASGNSGVINIKTKKNKLKGFNGSLTAGFSQGSYWRTNNSLNMNYRNAKYNAFVNLSYNKFNGFQQLTIHRKYKNEDGKSVNAIFEQQSFMKFANANQNIKAGMDFYLSEKTTMGFVASGFISPEDFKGRNTSYLKDRNSVVDSIVYATSHNTNRWKNASLNMNFRHRFDTTGRELTADVDVVTYSANNHQNFINSSFNPNWTKKNQADLLGILPTDINIYSAKADYVQNLKRGVKFEAGWKSSYVNTDNVAGYYNLVNAGWVPDYRKTNSFKYTENINAVYLNFNKQLKKIGLQTGLRYENTNYQGKQMGNPEKQDSSFRRSYDNLFPTVYISYAAGKKSKFGLNIGRRIDRPAYQDLNPFLFFIDNYTYNAGNPYLRPQFSNNVELSHTFKNFLTTTANYGITNNFFMETFEQSGYATIVRRGNIGKRNSAGISISAQIPVQKWWNASVYTNYNYNRFSGTLYGEKLSVEAGNLVMNINNQFKFNKGWGAELSGFYRTKGVEGQIMINPLGQLSAGVSKQVLKTKGSIRLNIRDIFYTQKVEGFINFQKTEAHFWNVRDSRVANLTFTYRFGKPMKEAPSNRKTGGSLDEQNRVKIGGN